MLFNKIDTKHNLTSYNICIRWYHPTPIYHQSTVRTSAPAPPIVVNRIERSRIHPSTSRTTSNSNTRHNTRVYNTIIYEHPNLQRHIRVRTTVLGVFTVFLITMTLSRPSDTSNISAVNKYAPYIGYFGISCTLAGIAFLDIFARRQIQRITYIDRINYRIRTCNLLGTYKEQNVKHSELHHGNLTYMSAINGTTYKFKIGRSTWIPYQVSKDAVTAENRDAVAQFLKYDILGSNIHSTPYNNSMINLDKT